MLFKNAYVFDKSFKKRPYDLRVKDGKIADLATWGALEAEDGEEVLDLSGKTITPGLIDQHTHGALGRDTMDANPESLEIISRHLASNGVTAFCPTTMTMGVNHLTDVFTHVPKSTSGATILGFHMEGPYINVAKKGAQNADYVRKADPEEIRKYQKLTNVLLISMAPEVNDNLEFIKEMHDEIVIQVGHCLSSYEDTIAAMKAGARGLCHGFNAMPPLKHREPGPVIASLVSGNYTEIIADGLHIHPSVVKATYKMFGPERVSLVSDAIKTTGQEDGEYMFGGQPIVLTNGVARVKASNALAGGSSNIWQEVKNCYSWGIDLGDALRMGSLTPAEYLGLDKHKGSIEEGKDADLVITNDDLDILDVYVEGEKFQ